MTARRQPQKAARQWLGAVACAAVAAGLAGLAICLALASPAGAAVTVSPPQGAPVTIDPAQMPTAPDVQARAYTLRSGGASRQVTVTGHSLAAIFEAAGIDPVRVGYLEIARPAGGSLLLSRRQALTDGAFPEGPPVVYVDAEGTHLLRPSSGEGDDNEADLITVAPGASLTIAARSGTLLQVKVTASTRKTKVGKSVRFEAELERSGAGEAVEYSWTFGDGSHATGAKADHAFKARGTYDVLVGVTSAGDRVGASGRVTIQVGNPVKQGPKRRGGGSNRNRKAPESGAADGRQGEATPGAGDPGPASPGNSYTPPPAASAPAPVAPPPIPEPTPAPKPEPPPEPKSEPEPQPRRPSGDEIAGQLLADSTIASQALEPDPAATASTEPAPVALRTGTAEPEGGNGGVPTAALGGGVVLLLLLGGGLLESRGVGRLRW